MKPLDASAADISRSDAFRAIAAVGRDKDGLRDDPSSALECAPDDRKPRHRCEPQPRRIGTIFARIALSLGAPGRASLVSKLCRRLAGGMGRAPAPQPICADPSAVMRSPVVWRGHRASANINPYETLAILGERVWSVYPIADKGPMFGRTCGSRDTLAFESTGATTACRKKFLIHQPRPYARPLAR